MRETPLKLLFDKRALAEWHKLDRPIRAKFKKNLEKLVSREETPSPRNRISGLGPNFYKIKQRANGYRLVYEYRDDALVITVIAVARRDRSAVYEIARTRLRNRPAGSKRASPSVSRRSIRRIRSERPAR